MMKQISLLVLFITLLGCKKEYTYHNNIKQDVVFLADDKLEGRATGTEGEKEAANYIATRFKEIGIAPKGTQDRKSTRLNSSHVKISYAVFCLKKKKTTKQRKRNTITNTIK